MFLCSIGLKIMITHYIEKSKHVFVELHEISWKNVMVLSKILNSQMKHCSWFDAI